MGKKKDSINYESLLEAIIKIDMFRDMKVTMPETLEKLLINSGVKGLREELRILKTETKRISGAIAKNKRFMRYTKYAAIFKIASVTGVLFIVAMIFASLILHNPFLATIALWYPVVFLAIVVLPNAYLITDYYARTELKIMKAQKFGGIAKSTRNLRDLNQRLINKLVEYALKDGKHPKKLRFKIWHLDYQKVRVVRNPWILGKYWLVEPDIPVPRR